MPRPIPKMEITISPADDWHHHLRDGEALATTVPPCAARFARAIIMPNLVPPVTTTAAAIAYRERILAALPAGAPPFEPLMTLYLTDSTTAAELRAAKESGVVHAVKLYPAGATTNSASGVTDVPAMYPVLREMVEIGLPLLVHSEVNDRTVDIFDREPVFIERVLRPLLEAVPGLRVVMEHITTSEAAEFVIGAPAEWALGATVTAHHLLFNRNAIFEGGIRPHMYCLPILKAEKHRRVLVDAVTGPHASRFFAGTDSAPHTTLKKYQACGCAGVYTAHAALELYAETFDDNGALDKLEPFLCHNGADFYGLPRNSTVPGARAPTTLARRAWKVPESYPFDGDRLVPLRAGQEIAWTLCDATGDAAAAASAARDDAAENSGVHARPASGRLRLRSAS